MTPPRWMTADRRRGLRRAFKIAVAATAATAIAKALELRNPWFATLAAIVAMEITLQASMRSARSAIIGAAIGAGAGLGLAMVAKDQTWAVGLLVFLGLGAFGWFRLENVGRQAAIVGTVIVLVPETSDVTTLEFAWVRFLETLIGIGVALVVNAAILPPRAYRGVRRNLAEAYQHLAAMYRLVIAAEATGTRDADSIVAQRRAFRSNMRRIDDLWDEALSERQPLEVLAPHWRATTRRIWEQCTSMDDAVMDPGSRGRLEGASEEIAALSHVTARALDEVAAALGSDRPPPHFPELESARAALLEQVHGIEVQVGVVPFGEALQAFSFVNAMSVIATRLDDLASEPPVDPAEAAELGTSDHT